MIETTLKSIFYLDKGNNWEFYSPIRVNFTDMNYLNLEIIKPLDDHRDQTEGFYSIVDLYHNQVKIRNEKFYDNIKRTFMRKGEIDLDKNPEAIACLLSVKIKDPIESIYLIRTKFANITGDLFKSLLTSKDQRKRLVKIADRFLSEDYEGMIKETGIIGEYLSKKFINKRKKKFTNFKSAIESLTNPKKNTKTKINYEYIGYLLHPIYYIRNEASHPNAKVRLDEDTALLVLSNLTAILYYLAENKIKF